jgi:hypothetical protein
MSILDDAIREHLELKRQHGADESELKRLEDEAFGPPGRPEEPDPFAEAPTEFMAQPEAPTEEPGGEGRRRINIADLQEPPPPGAKAAGVEAEGPEAAAEESPAPEAPEIEISHGTPPAEAAPIAPAEDPAQAAPPAEEEPPAMEHEVVAEPPAEEAPEAVEADAPEAEAPPEPSHSTEERHAIAEQPTEFFDIEAEIGAEEAPAVEAPSPSDEEIAEAEQVEPRLVPVADDEDEEDEEFWSDQRLSDELDQALEAPLTEEHEAPAPEPPAPSPEPTTSFFDQQSHEPEGERAEEHPNEYDPDTGHEDVLEDTPEFLEDAPEDDELWFEQRPPKDFDFDD